MHFFLLSVVDISVPGNEALSDSQTTTGNNNPKIPYLWTGTPLTFIHKYFFVYLQLYSSKDKTATLMDIQENTILYYNIAFV